LNRHGDKTVFPAVFLIRDIVGTDPDPDDRILGSMH